MLSKRISGLPALLTCAGFALSGCGSGTLPQAVTASPGGANAQRAGEDVVRLHKQRVSIRIFIPRAPRHLSERRMRPFFVANSTRGIAVIVYLHGGTTAVGTTNSDVESGSPLCHSVTGGRSCTVPGSAPAGNDDFVVKTYDAAPSGGGFAGAKQLAAGKATKTIVAGTANSLNLTVGGVVAKAAVALQWANHPVIDGDSQTVTVGALDADGNTIINDGWYNANGGSVTMALSVSNTSPVVIGLAPTTVSFASQTSHLTYTSSQATSAQVQNGISATISATPSNGGTQGSKAYVLTKPAITEWSVTTSAAYPEGLVVGPDNAIWFAENNGNAIGRITTNAAAGSHPSEFSSGMTSSAMPVALAVAPDDQKIWFTEFGIGKVASIDPTSHAITEYLTPSGSGSQPWGIVAGSDNNMWFTEDCTNHSNIGKFNANALDGAVGNISEHATNTAGAQPTWITSGPDGNLWFAEGIDKIGTMTAVASPVANEFALTSNSIGEGQISSGPDNALWFTEENPNSGHSIGRSTMGGTITLPADLSACTGCTGGTFTSAMGIVTGPDGALWFAENGNNAVARIDPTSHTVAEFKLPHSSSNPWGIIKGPDGALWFTECLGNRVGKIQ